MEIWHIWVIVALVLVVVEIFTQGFAVLCLAFGAVAAAVAAACSAGVSGQLIWFSAHYLITGVDALKGREAVVSERISAEDNTGRVAIDGDDWKAVSSDGSVIEKGIRVIILDVDSVILKVIPKSGV